MESRFQWALSLVADERYDEAARVLGEIDAPGERNPAALVLDLMAAYRLVDPYPSGTGPAPRIWYKHHLQQAATHVHAGRVTSEDLASAVGRIRSLRALERPGARSGALHSLLCHLRHLDPRDEPVWPVGQGPVRVADEVTGPRQVRAPAPAYPGWARRTGTAGATVVRLTVDLEGCTVASRLVEADHDTLGNYVKNDVDWWVFEPATVNGRPVAVHHDVVVAFSPPSDEAEAKPAPRPPTEGAVELALALMADWRHEEAVRVLLSAHSPTERETAGLLLDLLAAYGVRNPKPSGQEMPPATQQDTYLRAAQVRVVSRKLTAAELTPVIEGIRALRIGEPEESHSEILHRLLCHLRYLNPDDLPVMDRHLPRPVSPDMTAPRRVFFVSEPYDRESAAERRPAVLVILQATVDVEGCTVGSLVLHAPDPSVARTVKWTAGWNVFEPALRKGRPVPVHHDLRIRFTHE